MPAARLLALLLLLPGCFLFGEESEGRPADDCLEDIDCSLDRGESCKSGRCVAPPPGDDGIPPDPVLDRDACARSLDCVQDPFERDRARQDRTIYSDDGMISNEGEDVCAIARRTPNSSLSTTRCVAPNDGGRPGGFACLEDDECASSLCLALGGADDEDRAPRAGPGLCALLCSSDEDCPGILDVELGARIGLACTRLRLGERFVRACLPAPATAELTICANDRDCAADRVCRFRGADTLAQTREGPVPRRLHVPGCGPQLAPEADGPNGLRCGSDADCRSGSCLSVGSVDATTDGMNLSWIDSGAGSPDDLLCSQPCRHTADCPEPYLCREGDTFEAVGEPVSVEGLGGWTMAGLAVPRCMLATGGCVDLPHCLGFQERRDVDPGCCDPLYRHPGGVAAGACTCFAAPTLDLAELRCQLFVAGPRLGRSCAIADADHPLALGSCCTTSASCSTNLCIPTRADHPHPEGCANVCSTPCDDVPGQDRCAWFAPGGTYADDATPYPGAPGIDHVEWFAAARCETVPWDGPGTTEVPACR